ncbi:MAG: glycosyltransferase family 2 protein [Candidatus Levybacteria bacterium]|nr:glycosyltransferase family 2 protein [Candidatus Levybacteria bacterium]
MRFIGVVIAAFNEEKYLPKCLESLDNQTYPKDQFSVIVVDNNSTDKTARIAKEFGARVILEKKQGYVFALQKGMEQAKGDIIAVIDADTKVSSNWLKIIEKVFEDPNVVAITGRVRLDTKSDFINISTGALYTIFLHVSSFIDKPNLTGFNFAVRRDAFLKVGGLDTMFEMSPDIDLGIRLNRVGKVKVVNDLSVRTSARRWEDRFVPTLWEYAKGYVYTAWLRKPARVKQKSVR